MPWDHMSDQQLQEFLEVKSTLDELPGVHYIQPEYRKGRQKKLAIVVHLAPQYRGTIRQLPLTVAELPVIVMIEDPQMGTVLEVVDLRDGCEN